MYRVLIEWTLQVFVYAFDKVLSVFDKQTYPKLENACNDIGKKFISVELVTDI